MKLNWKNAAYSHAISETIITEHSIYKRGQKWAIDREEEFLGIMRPTGFVPIVERDGDVLKIQRIKETPISNTYKWMSYYSEVLKALSDNNINHGDLTSSNIIPFNNKPYIIDFGESTRLDDTTSKIKRPYGDAFWLKRGMIYHMDFDKYPVFYNERVPEMWEIIKPHLPYKVESLIDFGAGHCDLSIRTMIDKKCKGILIEQDKKLVEDMRFTMDNISNGIDYDFNSDNIFTFIRKEHTADVGYCCSVLPYFSDSHQGVILEYMARNISLCFIEVQYKDDGPGCLNGEEFYRCLEKAGFKNIEKIGYTLVDGRNKKRDIWKCY